MAVNMSTLTRKEQGDYATSLLTSGKNLMEYLANYDLLQARVAALTSATTEQKELIAGIFSTEKTVDIQELIKVPTANRLRQNTIKGYIQNFTNLDVDQDGLLQLNTFDPILVAWLAADHAITDTISLVQLKAVRDAL